jgi:hypothetical protein
VEQYIHDKLVMAQSAGTLAEFRLVSDSSLDRAIQAHSPSGAITVEVAKDFAAAIGRAETQVPTDQAALTSALVCASR